MRNARRLAVVSAVLGGGLLLAGPAVAQTAPDCDAYPDLAECQIDEDLGGGSGGPASGGPGGGGEDTGAAGGGAEGGTTTSAASLPFTGGEVTLIALAGTVALGGGIALTAVGRKRSSV